MPVDNKINISEIIVNNILQKTEEHLFVKEQKSIFENLHIVTIDFKGNEWVINGTRIESNRISGTLYSDGIDTLFKDCTFSRQTTFTNITQSITFKECTFEKVSFKNISCAKQDDNDIKFEQCDLNEMIIEKSQFSGRFYINPQYRDTKSHVMKINKLFIRDTGFNHNFKLHNCEIEEIDINNTDFEKNADFFKSKFMQDNEDINFKSINFKALCLFGECEFHSKFILEYVTFKGLTHFRESKFFNGFNLDKSNIEKEMNFFGVQGLENTDNISQETYRIIKYNCQKIGNQIEANKYHSLELAKRKEYLDKHASENRLDYIVFTINCLSSNFSTNWFLTLFWIFIVGMLTTFAIDVFEYDICEYTNNFLMSTFKYISIINMDDCLKKNPIIFALNKVSLGFLYYQFLTAVRKDTKK